VVALGRADADARETIDATGRVVAPGFVDIHTHYDAQILWDPMLTVSPWHGVTTVVMGNCGFGVAPTRPDHRDLIVRTLEKVEGMSADALIEGLGREWPFESFPDYLDALEARQQAINVGALIGHTPVRLYVMGEDATERAATDDEVAAMRAIVLDALEAGAIGFATSHAPTHVGYDGKPVPSRAAESEEIVEIASALGDAGRGVLQATLGSGLAFGQFREIAQRTGRPISWTALLAGMAGEGVDQFLLDESHKLVAEGLPVHPQVACRPLMFEFDLEEPFVFESMSMFKRISAGDHDEKLAAYRDPEFRAQLSERMLGKDGAGVLGGSWNRTEISWFPPDRSLEGRNLAALADERGIDATELALDLGLETDLDTRFRMAVANYDEDRVEELLTDPITMIGLSDAGAHASQLCDACFSTHLLSRWVRQRKAISVEEAVRMLTSEPADVFGITDRGRLAEGRPADVVVFDPETVGASDLRRVEDLPAGADRLVSDAFGIDAVVVNGTVIRRDGADTVSATDELPGRVLRGGSAG
jgi:N-acyl-D-aspartate/D-glutamate deacylase